MVYLINENKKPQKICKMKIEDSIILNEAGTIFTIFSPGEGKLKSGVYDKAKRSYVIKDIEDNALVLQQSNIVKSNKLLYMKKSIKADYELWSLDLINNTKELIQTGFKDNINPFSKATTSNDGNNFINVTYPQVIGDTIYYNFINGVKTELYIKKSGSKAIKVAETSGFFLPYNEDTVYYYVSSADSKANKYNLYVYKYGKTSELVASDVPRVSLFY